MTTLDRFFAGDVGALAQIVSHIENQGPGYRDLLVRLYRASKGAIRIGVTGPPGAGKSTVVDALARMLSVEGHSVAVMAVDPSSPFTGGALLGDRVRFHEDPSNAKLYFRSLATRGSSGGLSDAAEGVGVAFDAFGFAYTLIETVGVGQVELDIVDACDVVVVILVPESGDIVQTMKAGLSEIADVFVVNKSDRPGADRLVADLQSMLEIRRRGAAGATSAAGVASAAGAHAQQKSQQVNQVPPDVEWETPVIPTEATSGKNIDTLLVAIRQRLAFSRVGGTFDRQRSVQVRAIILRVLERRLVADAQTQLDSTGEIERAVDAVMAGQSDPYTAAEKLYLKTGVFSGLSK